MSMDNPIWRRRFFDRMVNRGPKGDRGEPGITGPKGDSGNVGSQGPAGPQGEQGIKGDRGDQGIPGPKGDKGDTGLQGIQGIKGDTGSQGPKGDTGTQGIQGIQGVKGDTGATGPAGTIQEEVGIASVPALLLGGSTNIVVPLSNAFPNTTYQVRVRFFSGVNLLSMLSWSEVSRTTSSVTIKVQANGLASVAAIMLVDCYKSGT